MTSSLVGSEMCIRDSLLCEPAPNDGGLTAGSHPSVSPGDMCGVDAIAEEPTLPATCELAPGVDMIGAVVTSGI
eukprot:5877991-Prorocentrum_lima.AAC.1